MEARRKAPHNLSHTRDLLAVNLSSLHSLPPPPPHLSTSQPDCYLKFPPQKNKNKNSPNSIYSFSFQFFNLPFEILDPIFNPQHQIVSSSSSNDIDLLFSLHLSILSFEAHSNLNYLKSNPPILSLNPSTLYFSSLDFKFFPLEPAFSFYFLYLIA